MCDDMTRDDLNLKIIAAFLLGDMPITADDITYTDDETIEVRSGDFLFTATIYSDDDGQLDFESELLDEADEPITTITVEY